MQPLKILLLQIKKACIFQREPYIYDIYNIQCENHKNDEHLKQIVILFEENEIRCVLIAFQKRFHIYQILVNHNVIPLNNKEYYNYHFSINNYNIFQ